MGMGAYHCAVLSRLLFVCIAIRPPGTMAASAVWRFGYGSNMSVANLIKKKNLTPLKHVVGICKGFRLSFNSPGIDWVEPAFACIEEDERGEVHGVAFQIPEEQARGLDAQEGGYTIRPMVIHGYDGGKVQDVGVYIPKRKPTNYDGLPSLRYIRLLIRGAEEAGLDAQYIQTIREQPHYITPPEVRRQTERAIQQFENDEELKHAVWSAEELARYDGTSDDHPAHTSILGYIVQAVAPFRSWRGHTITRRNLVHFRGESVDTNDIRVGSPGFLPLPKLSECTDEEIEYLHQNLDTLIQRNGKIVARLKDFLQSQ